MPKCQQITHKFIPHQFADVSIRCTHKIRLCDYTRIDVQIEDQGCVQIKESGDYIRGFEISETYW